MSTLTGTPDLSLTCPARGAQLALAITRAASRQTYYTIRLLADRDRAADAFRAYAYFRWVDDCVDEGDEPPAQRAAFLRRQQALVEAGYRGRMPDDLSPEERLLADLIAADGEPDSGLRLYLDNMMAVMAYDLERRGRLITACELAQYEAWLSAAVMGALLHFIGHDTAAPAHAPWADDSRTAAARGACVIHMLRDLIVDCETGYYNIPAEYLAANSLSVLDRDHPAFHAWVAARVGLARDCFREGRRYIARLDNGRCRLAGRAYIARFEYVARLIERDLYHLRPAYPERQSFGAAVWMMARAV